MKVETLRKFDAAWDDDERIEELLQRLERVDGVRFFKGPRMRWPRTPLAPLASSAKRQAFLAVIADVISELDIAT